MGRHIFSKFFELKKQADIDELSRIIEESQEKAEEYTLNLLEGKLLAPPLEVTFEIKNSGMKVLLEENLIISPLSPLISKEGEIALKIAEKFFEILENRLREANYV